MYHALDGLTPEERQFAALLPSEQAKWLALATFTAGMLHNRNEGDEK